MSKTPTKPLEEHLAWLGISDCTCRPYEWLSFGLLDGFHMGYGWNRIGTADDCPHHQDPRRKK